LVLTDILVGSLPSVINAQPGFDPGLIEGLGGSR